MTLRLLLPRAGLARPTGLCLVRRSYTTAPPSSTDTVPGPPYNILFCGTDTFATPSLSALLSHPHLCSNLHVLTPPDTTQSWGATRMRRSPVKTLALTHSLPQFDVPPSGLTSFNLPPSFPLSPSSILLTCSFGHLIPSEILDKFPNPWQRLNIHPSLLPKLRGAGPIQWALARRLERSGVTVQTLEKGRFDTGRVVAQEAFSFPPVDGGFMEVEKVMAERAAELLVELLTDLPGHWGRSWEQDEGEKSYAPKLKAEHSVVKWDKWTAADVVARERGFGYLYPLSTSLQPPGGGSSFKPVPVALSNTSTLPHADLLASDSSAAGALLDSTTAPGSALFSAPLDALLIKTLGDEALLVRSIKVQGKKLKSASDWWKAYRDRSDPHTGLVRFQ